MSGAPGAEGARAGRLLAVMLTASDLAGSAAFFRDGLGFGVQDPVDGVDDPGLAALLGAGTARVVRLRLGGQRLALAAFDPPGRAYPADGTACDLWFQHVAIVVSDMAAAHAAAMAHGAVPISTAGPQRLPAASGGVTAWKFRDPEGHPLELLAFPPGGGDPAWRGGGPGVFLGFDHSAVAVADAARSRRYYVGALGLVEAGATVNRGVEQDQLDGLAGALVDVVALRPGQAPPHVELLAYRHPRGRTGSVGATDVAATRLVLAGPALDGAEAAIAGAGGRVLGRGTFSLAAGPALWASDPDGHEVLLVESQPPV